jgi:hypothetical protein
VLNDEIKLQLRIACLEAMRIFGTVRISSGTKVFEDKIEADLKELNELLNILDRDIITNDSLKQVAKRITHLNNELIKDGK